MREMICTKYTISTSMYQSMSLLCKIGWRRNMSNCMHHACNRLDPFSVTPKHGGCKDLPQIRVAQGDNHTTLTCRTEHECLCWHVWQEALDRSMSQSTLILIQITGKPHKRVLTCLMPCPVSLAAACTSGCVIKCSAFTKDGVSSLSMGMGFGPTPIRVQAAPQKG